MIQVNQLAKSYGDQVLFEDASFTVGAGERIGLIGRNGSGKSTLLRILLGEELADKGEIKIPARYRISSLKQHLSFTEPTILAEVCLALQEEEQFDTFKAEKILMGLGFTSEDFKRAPSEFSGGMQIRLNLAKVLLENPDCLFLDEPTNYLDIIGMRWLSKFLRGFAGSLVLITHDRGFMDEVSTHTMGIWRSKIYKLSGNTSKFYQKMEQDEEIYQKTQVNLERKKKQLEEFVERFRAKATKATQAQSRLKMLEKMPTMEDLQEIENLKFKFNFLDCPGKILLEATDLSFGWTHPLFQNLNLQIERNDKICVIGKNGKGKSTLLNVLAQNLVPLKGAIKTHPSMKLGHFGQTNINTLYLDHTVEEEIATANNDMTYNQVRNICGTMMFSGSLAEKKISVLSGGERARVLLGKILAWPTNLLLLDEPSNHLDIQSIDSLLSELKAYKGAVVVVSHSEEFVRQLATKLVIFHEDRVEVFAGSYDEFLTKGGWGDEEIVSKDQAPKKDRNLAKRLRAEVIQERSRVLNPLKKKISDLEASITKDEERIAAIEESLIAGSSEIAKLSMELGTLKKKVDVNFEAFSDLTVEHDQIFARFEQQLKEIEA
jgi:ATP-binding cassette subfamily F protein 3